MNKLEVVTWADLPGRTRRAATRPSPLVSEAVQLTGIEDADGRSYQLATGWRVYDDAVVLAGVRRPLPPTWRAALGPGRWEHERVRSAPFVGPVRRRRGVVPVDGGATEPTESPETTPATNPAHAQAADAWRHLPAPVRAAAERLVPEPVVWLGAVTQVWVGRNPLPVSESVRVLRVSATRALLVVAERSLSVRAGREVDARLAQLARTPWVVDQVGGDL